MRTSFGSWLIISLVAFAIVTGIVLLGHEALDATLKALIFV